MPKRWLVGVIAVAALVVGYLLATREPAVEGQEGEGAPQAFAAVPGEVGAMDIYGPYQVAENWPKDISTLPGNEKWTWGAGQGVFAESPNRVIYIQRGQLPVLPQPAGRGGTPLPQVGPNLVFPVAGLWRNATQASPPGALEINGKVGDDSDAGTAGVDFLWENCIVIIDRDGNIVETWKQWDKMLRRPHSVYISPYDPEKHVYVVDDYRHAIFKFTNDGKTLVQTIGEPNVHASDDKHFYRPTFMAFQTDGSFYVADGYLNTRVVKFDKDGKYLTAWGERGEQGKETRPGFFNNVHGVAVDPVTRQVFVNDRNNRRIQVFDENGKYLREWKMGWDRSNLHFVHIDADRRVWVYDQVVQKLIQYDLDGRLVYAWG
jgi:DNA-binding beta-propeller fold protein YncE